MDVSGRWRAWAREVLEGEERATALPFLAEVTGQVAHRHRAADGSPQEEAEVGARALELLLDPDAAAAVRRLVAEPPMLAAFFQNVDLLYAHHDPGADAVAGLVMRALELAEGLG